MRNEHSCPTLFFARRAIIGSPEDTRVTDQDLAKYLRWGFDVRHYATEWEDLRLTDCGASRGLCPSQPRFFTDPTARCARFDVFDVFRSKPSSRRSCGTWRTGRV